MIATIVLCVVAIIMLMMVSMMEVMPYIIVIGAVYLCMKLYFNNRR